MENELERIKEFEANILVEIKKLYNFNKDIEVTVTTKFYRYKNRIFGNITVDSQTLYISDFVRNKILTNALQSIRVRTNTLDFEIVSRLPQKINQEG